MWLSVAVIPAVLDTGATTVSYLLLDELVLSVLPWSSSSM